MTTTQTTSRELTSDHAELGFNQYGKAENRLVHIEREGNVPPHHGRQCHLAAARRLRRGAHPR